MFPPPPPPPHHHRHHHPHFHAYPFRHDHDFFFGDHPFVHRMMGMHTLFGPPPSCFDIRHGGGGLPMHIFRKLAKIVFALILLHVAFHFGFFLLSFLFSPLTLAFLVFLIGTKFFHCKKRHGACFGAGHTPPGPCWKRKQQWRRRMMMCGKKGKGGKCAWKNKCEENETNNNNNDEEPLPCSDNDNNNDNNDCSFFEFSSPLSPNDADNIFQTPTPHIHKEESDEAMSFSLDLPGYTLDDIKITMDDEKHILTVSGERTNKLGHTYQLEQKFCLNKETTKKKKITASFTDDDGILTICIPKKAAPAPRVITINADQENKNDTNNNDMEKEEIESDPEENNEDMENNQNDDNDDDDNNESGDDEKAWIPIVTKHD